MTEKLVEGESYSVYTKKSDNKKYTEDEINKQYMSGEIRIITEQGRYPLNQIFHMFKDEKYIVQPDFQRRRRWDIGKKSRLIESFIMNVPIPPIFLYEVDYAKYEVMDGLQRITTICEFYNDGFALKKLDEWTSLNGYRYSELPSKVRDGIDRRYLSSIILLKESAKNDKEAYRMKRLVFDRLNTGGEKLSPQEKRNALIDGEFNKMCIELSSNEYFKETWNLDFDRINEIDAVFSDESEVNTTPISKLYQTMGDVELVLRFFALRHLDKFTMGISAFLDNYLENANGYSAETRGELKKIFTDTIEFGFKLMGNNIFSFYDFKKEKWIAPSRTIYDPIVHVLYMQIENKHILLKRKDSLREKLKTMYSNKTDEFIGKKQSRTDIEKRIKLINDVFCSVIEDER